MSSGGWKFVVFLLSSLPFLIKGEAEAGHHQLQVEEGTTGLVNGMERRSTGEESISPNVGLIEEFDPQDFPMTGLSPQQALDLLFERYKARMLDLREPRMFGVGDLSDNEVGEMCGSSASLECGKKVLKYTDNSDLSNNANIHRKCNLRKDFLECIDIQRQKCRNEIGEGIYPRLPPKSSIRSSQSKIWRALWTSGGCVLAN